MANIKSQIKRNKQNEKRRLRNRVYAGRARTYVKKAKLAMEQGEVEEAREMTSVAISALDKAVSKGILHKNNVARRKSRLLRALKKVEQETAE